MWAVSVAACSEAAHKRDEILAASSWIQKYFSPATYRPRVNAMGLLMVKVKWLVLITFDHAVGSAVLCTTKCLTNAARLRIARGGARKKR